MPTYQFIHTETGEVVEKTLTFDQHSKRVKDGKIRIGKLVFEQIVSGGLMTRLAAAPIRGPGRTYPMKCLATGTTPEQIPEQMAADRAAGVHGVEYCPKTGDAIYTCRSMRKQHVESLGMYDRSGGYSDPQRK